MKKLAIFIALLIPFSGTKSQMHGQEGYRLPPKEIVDIIDAEPDPGISFSPDSKWMALIERNAMPDIADVARRMLRLGGMRIDPKSNGRFQTSFSKGMLIRQTDSAADNSDAIRVPIAEGEKLGSVRWAHDSSGIMFTTITDSGTTLNYVTPDKPGSPVRLHNSISTVMGGLVWMPDAKHILAFVVPSERGDEPAAPAAPFGPNIQESSGDTSPTRTYQDLLTNQHDEELFEHYTRTQLAMFSVTGGSPTLWKPAIYTSVSPSPDGNQILITTLEKPFSYLMTYRSFPRQVFISDLKGNKVHMVAEIPMDENIPIEGVRMGPRNIDWMSSRDATLCWFEALDGGDPNKEAEHRDRLMSHPAPFDSEPMEMAKVEHRAYGISFFENPSQILTTEYDRDRRWLRVLMHDLGTPGSTPKTVEDRSIRDRYGDPGRIQQVSDDAGHMVALQNGNTIYRSGAGASPKGNLPFLDAQDLTTLETKRLWRCEEGALEAMVRVAKTEPGKAPVVITDYEDPKTPANFRMRDLNDGSSRELTEFKDPTPQIRGIKKQLVKYERKDGVPLSATLYLPADYKEGTRLPLLVWAYPQEFSDASTAGQISGSPSRFTRMRSITHLSLLTQGYAIMDAATMPIIGDPETMNDTFIEQIVDAAQAAIDHAVELGVADRNRVGVGGHSYGAFMTANLMAHCDLFQAGLARSGAYNRTLTPFGFQSERRPYWKAKKIYHSISPFMHADKINEPLLLIHGEADNNSGTFPIQSKRLYQAIKGNGGTSRLVMLPHESHGYRARQSVLHTQAEMVEWMDKYVKNAPKGAKN